MSEFYNYDKNNTTDIDSLINIDNSLHNQNSSYNSYYHNNNNNNSNINNIINNNNSIGSNNNGIRNNRNYALVQNNNKKSKETQPLVFGFGLALDTLIKFAYAPVERLQILQQVQPIIPEINNRPSYNHIVSAFSTITKEQGIESLWRGATAGLIRFIPSHVANYIIDCYETKPISNRRLRRRGLNDKDIQKYEEEHKNDSNVKVYIVSPFIKTLKWLNNKSNLSVAVTMALGYPLNLARVRLAADVGVGDLRTFHSISDCLGHIYSHGGIFCMYQGWIESYIAYILYNYSAKTAYKQSMNYLFGKNISRPPLWKQWFIGQLVTRTAYIFIYPLETVKLRLMMQAGNKHIRYRHGWECLWRIMRDEGFLSLYKGIDVVLLSEILGWGIILGSGLVMDWLVGKLVGADKNKPKPDHEIKRLNN
ncbi:mitochondrial carrier [Anaeromyces robustus]|uniref:ADP/ATP translocase n=1 Tax=Anaeromyces robustus TaxID=1754192 RepID=A0A1Y1WH92_9FUNG|nr:mitochondrial carrier [Anaeromyces robustus]|eukprot:ORX72596.1 mitochondrial carrier [Anaeromyces robustus]